MPLVLHAATLLLSVLFPAHGAPEVDCALWQDLDSAVVHKEGQVILAGMFPLHSKGVEQELNFSSSPGMRRCRGLNLRALRWSQAMIFFINEINRNPDLLPNITLGYRLYDTCWLVALSMRTALSVVSQPIKRSQTGACLAPTVSYFASCACLSDKKQFPYFFRTVPSDSFQASAVARLIKHLGWSWVGMLGTDDDYGYTATGMCTAELTRLGVCVAFHIIIPKVPSVQQIQGIVKTIQDSTARVLVCFATEEEIEPVMEEVVRQNVTGRQWVASEAWITSTLMSTTYPSLVGTIGFAISRATIPGLQKFLHNLRPLAEPYNPSAREFWETQFSCSFNKSKPVGSMADAVHYNRTCTGEERIEDTETAYNDVSQLRVTYNVHKAVYAAAQALHNLFMCQRDESTTDKHSVLVYHSLSVLLLFSDQSECTLCPEDLWSSPQRDSCVDKHIEFLSYTEGFGMALAAMAILGIVATMTVASIFLRHRDTPLVRANNSELSFLLLLSLTLCFLCALTFLGQPTRWACPLRRTAFGLTFALCLSCLLSKTLVVLMAFKATLPGNNMARWFRPPQQRLGVFLCSALQCVICITWLTTAPPYPVKNTWLYRDRIVLECHMGSVALFSCVLGYIGCLAVFCFILAFLARKLPDNFNEAKFITFSMLIFCAVWITFIPAYVSSPGKFTVAVEIFAILASGFGVLLCIFVPKCYIIIFIPEKNTKKYLMSQSVGR
uniref:Olfactory receptor C family, w1 n=1 Tax=Electrophorus electricus TaxID=8005 RepID=A0A4W4FQ68_ELEEL